MKILITTDCYVPTVNGVVTSILNLETELRRLGHVVKVLCPSQNIHCSENGEVYMIGSVCTGKLCGGARAAVRLSRRYIKDFIRWRPDVIHSQSEFTSFLMAKRIAKAVGCPIVHTYHTVYENYTHYFSPSIALGRKAARIFTRKIIGQVQGVVAPSAKIQKMLYGYGINKPVEVIPTGLDLTAFAKDVSNSRISEIKTVLNVSDEDKILLTVGRTAKEKNIDELLHFFKKLARSKTKLLIVGAGPCLGELKQTAKALDISDKVIFTGMVQPEKINEYYRLGDVFLSASKSETQGLTYIEALASGVPVVCRDDACLTGIIENGKNGFRYQQFADFAEAVNALLDNSRMRQEMSENACLTVGRYSRTAFAEKIQREYLQVIEQCKRERSDLYESENTLSPFKSCG